MNIQRLWETVIGWAGDFAWAMQVFGIVLGTLILGAIARRSCFISMIPVSTPGRRGAPGAEAGARAVPS